MDSELFPLPAVSTAPSSALIVEQSSLVSVVSPSTGPFQSVRLILFVRFMIAAIQDLAREPNQEASGKTAAYLDACNLFFEQGFLSRRRINNRDSPVLANIKRGMRCI